MVELLADDDCWPFLGPAFDPPGTERTPLVDGVDGPAHGVVVATGEDGEGALAAEGVTGEAGAPWGDPTAGMNGPDGAAGTNGPDGAAIDHSTVCYPWL